MPGTWGSSQQMLAACTPPDDSITDHLLHPTSTQGAWASSSLPSRSTEPSPSTWLEGLSTKGPCIQIGSPEAKVKNKTFSPAGHHTHGSGLALCITHPLGWVTISLLPSLTPSLPPSSLPWWAGGLAATHTSFTAIVEADTTVSALWSHNIYPSPMGPGEAHQGRLSSVQPPLLSRRAAASPWSTGAILGVWMYLAREGFWGGEGELVT